jgi:hypothetical protein
MKTFYLISLITIFLSCSKETVNNQDNQNFTSKSTIEVPLGPSGLVNSPVPLDFYFVIYDVKSKQVIEKEVPKFFVLKENGEKIYTDQYISPNSGVIKYADGAMDVKWVAFNNACMDSNIQISGAFREHASFGLIKDGFKDFHLEWKDKDLGILNYIFEGYDKYNRPILKGLEFNKKVSKTISTCGGLYALEINQ